MRLQEIAPNLALTGLEPDAVVTVLAVNRINDDAVQVFYQAPNSSEIRSQLLLREQEAAIAAATEARPWSFDGDGAAFIRAVEAKRIELAYLFDPMMAVHTSNVEPLPHQITAVYESMLPRQPLRFLLADDPGAGKTIMAGLYMRELLLRADSQRLLVVAPGSLVEQWRAELRQKFGLHFHVYSRELAATVPAGNPFAEYDLLIVRLDQFARNPPLQEQLAAAEWDLVIFDEAHKLSSHWNGDQADPTQRFKFAAALREHTRHLLLMTATPHNGNDDDFHLFLSLLDPERFEGQIGKNGGAHDAGDLMRRMVKEELVKFDGTPLFPERRAYTVNYTLSAQEYELYELVTDYVKTQMGKADELAGARKGSVGFAMTTLQRRLASSPQAIYESLRRRRQRLERRLDEVISGTAGLWSSGEEREPQDDDDLGAEEREQMEETVVDQATAARTLQELQQEIAVLLQLERRAHAVLLSGHDRKWEELSRLLQNEPALRGPDDDPLAPSQDSDEAAVTDGSAPLQLRKLIIFSEHRDTLNYLAEKITGVLGSNEAVITIHGGTGREERLRLQEKFRNEAPVRVLVATDAAGEGVNLQTAHLMVNYDLPWNPNRLEQRFGRIHRIGQTKVCHLWNLVAAETREGEVYHRLLVKLANEGKALKGRVFDILGMVFDDKPLKQLLMEAIREGDRPEVRANLKRRIESAFDPAHIQSILERNALAQETMSTERLYAVRSEMEKAEARKLQPFFVRAFFLDAFASLGGSIHPREPRRYEIKYVPPAVREQDRKLHGQNVRHPEPVVSKYERVCFTKDAMVLERANTPEAVLLHPGHPLLRAVTARLLENAGNLLRQGAILVDPNEEASGVRLIFLLTHEIRDGLNEVVSQRLQFVSIGPDGTAGFGGWAPHLDLEPLPAADRPLLGGLLAEPWIGGDPERMALSLAAASLAPEHMQEVAARRVAEIDKIHAAVHDRLSKEIARQTERWMKLRDEQAAGRKVVPATLENYRRTVEELQTRLEQRKRRLQAQRHLTAAAPVVVGGALVVPKLLVERLRAVGAVTPEASAAVTKAVTAAFAADAAARARVERIAMEAVRAAEEARGCTVVDVSAAKCGWDLTSHPPSTDGPLGEARHIEVKGRVRGAPTVTLTRNEILYALNQGDKFVLAVVLVGEDGGTEGPYYIRQPFRSEPEANITSINYNLHSLLEKASPS